MTLYDQFFLFTFITILITRLLSISMGIFLDEIGFILTKGKTHEDNYSPKSFMILLFFILLLFLYKESIINFYL